MDSTITSSPHHYINSVVFSTFDTDVILSTKYKQFPNTPQYFSYEQQRAHQFCISKLLEYYSRIKPLTKLTIFPSQQVINNCKLKADRIMASLISGVIDNMDDIEHNIYNMLPDIMKIRNSYLVLA